MAGFSITYSPLSSDFTCYYRPNVSRYEIQILEKLHNLKVEDFASWKIFLSSYAGLLLPIVCINFAFTLFTSTLLLDRYHSNVLELPLLLRYPPSLLGSKDMLVATWEGYLKLCSLL